MIGLIDTEKMIEEATKVDLTTAILVNIPTAAAIIYVVQMFLKENKDKRKEDQECKQELKDAILKNTVVIGKNTEVMGAVKESITRCIKNSTVGVKPN